MGWVPIFLSPVRAGNKTKTVTDRQLEPGTLVVDFSQFITSYTMELSPLSSFNLVQLLQFCTANVSKSRPHLYDYPSISNVREQALVS